jgi:hypothetical protein
VNTIRIIFAILVVSFISADILGATAILPQNSAGKMVSSPDQNSSNGIPDNKFSKGKMVFWRHMADGPACLEYSWVPEGKRRMVQLGPGTKEGGGPGPSSQATHVQVYSMSNNGRGGVKKWQFPPGRPHSGNVVGATVEVRGMEIVGTVYYSNGTTAVDRHQIDPSVHTCVEGPKKK